jgi:hypothetical protein
MVHRAGIPLLVGVVLVAVFLLTAAPPARAHPDDLDNRSAAQAGTGEREDTTEEPTTEPMRMARGAEPGAVRIRDPLEPRPGLAAGDWALLGGSVAVGLVGVWLALRRRPATVSHSEGERHEQD